jgi:N6-adenosine-specific RNA methylase IME4
MRCPNGPYSEDVILDGRNRLRACQLAGVEPTFVNWWDLDVPEDTTILDWIVSENQKRRHDDVSQRSMSAAALMPLYQAQARERQGARTDLQANLPESGQARDHAAAAMHVSPRSVESAVQVTKRGAAELVDAVKQGRVAVSTAAVLVEDAPEKQREVVARGEAEILKRAKEIRAAKMEERRAERVEKLAEIARGNEPLPVGQTGAKYPVIYADPPWRYEHAESSTREIENHYPTMALEDICALPVADLATPDAILFLWATSPKLAEAMRVVESWGFTYRTCAVWVKDKIGMGYYFRQRHELLLVATRGAMPTPAPANRPDSVIEAPLGKHSAKPAEVAEQIEAMYPGLPWVELFCRAPRAGWAAWGNQAA